MYAINISVGKVGYLNIIVGQQIGGKPVLEVLILKLIVDFNRYQEYSRKIPLALFKMILLLLFYDYLWERL